MSNSSSNINNEPDQAPEPLTRTIEYKIIVTCSRCGYRDSLYNKHEYTKGISQVRNLMWRCMKCDKDQVFNYTVGKEGTG